jgi:methyl coenzyme M reductase subunit C-like uncharacterized protein (methanogenesis marker protein 7)
MFGPTDLETGETGHDKLRRTAASMISDLSEAVQALSDLIREERDRSKVKDPNDFAYPLSARSLENRLANIRSTISSLKPVADQAA